MARKLSRIQLGCVVFALSVVVSLIVYIAMFLWLEASIG